MKRLNRSMEVFSVSAIDLFASSLGAFMIITIILFPYYKKEKAVSEVVAKLTELNEDAKKAAGEAKRKAEEKEKEASEAVSKSESFKQLKNVSEELEKITAELKTKEQKLQKLAAEADFSIPFALLGLRTKAKRFVVVFDMSRSISKDGYTQLAIETLQRIINSLDEKASLAIIGFHQYWTLHVWPPQRGMRKMTDANKRQALSFACGLRRKFSGGTPTYLALSKALEYNPEAILLVSDGQPTDEKYRRIVSSITAYNKARAEIHSVALGNYLKKPELVDFLRTLASRNKGTFIGVAR